MSNLKNPQTLLRGFVILSVVVLAAFTTNGAWASTPTAGDVSGKKPPTTPQTSPLGNPCLANGVHSALYLSCLKNGSNLSSNTHVSQNRGSNSNSKTVTSNQSKIKNNSSSSSKNSGSLNQQLINIGRLPTPAPKGSTKLSTNSNKGNDPSSTKNQSKLTVNNVANPALTTKDPSKLTTTKDPSKLTTSKDPSKLTTTKDPSKLTTTKDPSKLTTTKASDPPSSSTATRELLLIQRFESLTGHHLTSAQIKALAKSGSLSSEGQTRFVQSLEKVTGNEISNSQVTQVEGSGSGSVNSEGETALIQRFERLTGHNLTSTQLTDLEGSGSLNSEGETQFLASLEKVTGHELSNTEVTAVEGSGSINSEGESSSTQHVENVTGQEIGSEEAAEVEGSTSEEAEETSSEENAENNVETTTTENNESASTQIAEGEIVPITGGVATTTSTILAGTVGSLNNQTTGVDTFVIGNTNVQVNSGLSGANQIQNGLNVELGGTVDSNGNFVASSVMAVTNNAITVVSGTVSSLNETGSVDTFLIGNTTIQLGDSLEGTTEFTNGETIKLDGFFTSSENFVATSIVSVTQ